MPPEGRREEDELEEEAHIKTDRRASRDLGEEPAEEPSPEATDQPPEAEEAPAEPAEGAEPEEHEPSPEGEAKAKEAPPAIDVYSLLRMSIGMYAEQAWIHMGVRMDSGKQKTEENLPLAKVAIDTVALLAGQLQPQLTPEEKRELDSLLADLRINYVQRT